MPAGLEAISVLGLPDPEVVMFVARGSHLDAIQKHALRVESILPNQ